MSILLVPFLLFARGDAVVGAQVESPSIAWNARTVEHILNRAGFGGSRAEIERALLLGREKLVDELLRTRQPWTGVEPTLFRWEDFGLDHKQVTLATSDYNKLAEHEQLAMCKDARVVDRDQFLEEYRRWFASMSAHGDPLRDRMTLFWHGFFTTSWEVVKRKYELIHQFERLRAGALGSYADLLRGAVRDPAILQYLDNTTNRAGHPNENLARELFEMFSLGEGRFSELDVRETARALTGYAGASDGTFEFVAADHDAGLKTVLGVTGPLDADDVVEIVLAKPECARWVAMRLLRSFEGVSPGAERVERYATLLLEDHYAIEPFLRTLLADPEFFREDVIGTRVAGPIEWLAGACRKLGVDPPGHFLNWAGVKMGQSFYLPPTVKGWPEGLEWITNDSLLRRSQCIGVLVGAIEVPIDGDEGAGGSMNMGSGTLVLAETLEGARWDPQPTLERLAAGGARDDASIAAWICSEWLAIEPPSGTVAVVRAYLARERAACDVGEGALDAADPRVHRLVRRLAQFVFSLPEAQLL